MARYRRDFLVPYLHDICALYLADQKLEKIIFRKEELIRQYRGRRYVPKPTEPHYESESGNLIAVGGLVFAIMGVIALIQIYYNPNGIGQMPMGVAIFVCLFWTVLGGWVYAAVSKKITKAQEKNESLKMQYEQALLDYEKEIERAEQERTNRLPLIPKVEKEIRALQNERAKAKQTLRYVYGANIIPSHYRNFYAAIFLYDWFSHGGSDDMDMALNTFVLEEIKDRLDIIIEQQSQMILNQRVMLARQQKNMDDQERHNALMRRKIDRIHATQEERLHYDRMIEANTAANAYFAAANYFK